MQAEGPIPGENAMQPELDRKKLSEIIIFISQQSEKDERFGATKLNKILFYSDFHAYVNFGKSITGCEYKRQKNGPCPHELPPMRDTMEVNRDIGIKNVKYHGLNQKRTIALRDPDLSIFSGSEIALVQKIIDKYWDLSAREISEKSHEFIGWKLAEEKESIPYEVAFVSSRPLTDQEIAYGLQLANQESLESVS